MEFNKQKYIKIPQEKVKLGVVTVNWDDNIKMSLKKKEDVACSHAAQNEGLVMGLSSVLPVSQRP
jgi:hypothetical protein